ncbi:hypothetical protein RRG08_048958 [Elysia crispata]|uniref:Uncharacterized protein n=1 Tax=Elysia crispata TaxID=231223 RepID=A0AAE0YDB4_9GAST|nr:hypothetical protein RRG08_048958 [Elysia crispata]
MFTAARSSSHSILTLISERLCSFLNATFGNSLTAQPPAHPALCSSAQLGRKLCRTRLVSPRYSPASLVLESETCLTPSMGHQLATESMLTPSQGPRD